MTSIARSVSFRAFSAIRSSYRVTVQMPRLDRRTFSGSTRVSVIKFTKDHEWIQHDPSVSDIATVGITAYAAHALGDAVFVELPNLDTEVAAGDPFGAVESVKSASDIMSPVSGIVVETNQKLADKPSLINKSPEKDGWILKIKVSDASELDGLMEASEYEAYVKK
ncbi:glycine cleavage system H-protein subunit [Maublancomyces gigas]|uniref:Glycine cleavage system H protein n=1 Tax=Discina gigas TaxID=1032678 RepID=A0ABR3GHU7_9PEZI